MQPRLGSLPLAERDAAFGQIRGREFDAHLVARDDADKVLPHPARDMGHHLVPSFDLHLEARIGEGLSYSPLNLQRFFLRLRHTHLSIMRMPGRTRCSPELDIVIVRFDLCKTRLEGRSQKLE